MIEKFVPEVIRWQMPLAYMRRTATKDTVLNGRRSRRTTSSSCGTSPPTWTRTSSTTPKILDIDRENADRQLSFGYGIHFCMEAALPNSS